MARLSLEVTGLDSLRDMRRFLQPQLWDKAVRGGVSYAAKAVPPAVAKGITAGYNIQSGRVKQDISGIRFLDEGQTATIRFSRRPPTLAQYRPNPGRRGRQRGLGRGRGWAKADPPGKPLSATVIRSRGRQPFAGAFLASGANGNRLVLRRGPNDRLISLYGPSTGSIFLGQSEIGSELRRTVQDRISEQYAKGFQRVISAAARGYGGR